MSTRKLAKNIGSMSVAVMISRIFGLLRDIFMTNYFGTTIYADAFRVAYQLPNFLRRLFGEGALSAAFIPLYAELGINRNKKTQIKFALNMLSILSLCLLILSILGILFAPFLIKLIAPGFSLEAKLLVIKLTRILFPYLFFIGLSSTLISILNAHDKFFLPGLSSAFLNIAMVGSLGVFVLFKPDSSLEQKIVVWSFGVIFGGLLQTIVNFPLLKKVGYTLKLQINLKSNYLRTVWQKLIPGAIGIAVRQINLVADLILASFLVSGSIAALGYGNRLMQLPMGIFGVATGVAVLPLFSRFVAEKNWRELTNKMRFSIISLSYIMLPVTAIIAGLGKDIIRLLFQRGRFDLQSVEMTYAALLFYSLGIIFYSMNRVIIPVFYANKDTKTPVKISAIIVFFNIILNIILMYFLQHAGLALSTSICAAIQTFFLLSKLKKKIPQITFPNIWKTLMKITLISLLIFLIIIWINSLFTTEIFYFRIMKVLILSSGSFLLFFLFTKILKVEFSAKINRQLWKKIRKR